MSLLCTHYKNNILCILISYYMIYHISIVICLFIDQERNEKYNIFLAIFYTIILLAIVLTTESSI